jgi:hypothetical protein
MRWVIFLFILTLFDVAYSQSLLQLRKGKGAGQKSNYSSSSRYEVRATESAGQRQEAPEVPSNVPAPVNPTPLEQTKPSVTQKVVSSPLQVEPKEMPEQTDSVFNYDSNEERFGLKPEESLGSDIERVVLGGKSLDLMVYKSQLPENDIRKNKLELSVAPVLMTGGLSSSYSFFNYKYGSAGYQGGLDFWLSPFSGISFAFTRSSDSAAKISASSNALVTATQLDFGMKIRSFETPANPVERTSWLFGYVHNSVETQQSQSSLMGFQTLGMYLGFQKNYSEGLLNSLDFRWMPSLSSSELGGDVVPSPGTRSGASGISISFGGEHFLDRKNQIYWFIKSTYIRSQYTGSADILDGITNTKPENVSVESLNSILGFGYRWGR